jgi:hypothetical protein
LEFGVSAKVSESDHRSWASVTIQPDVSEPDESDHQSRVVETTAFDVFEDAGPEFVVSGPADESDHQKLASATIQPDASEPVDESDHRKLASVTIQLDVSGPDESDHQRMESVTTAFDVSGIWDAQLWSRRIRPTASAVLDLRWCTLG